MATKKEHFEETLANVKRGHRLHEWESAAVNLAWMSELYVDELQNEVKRLTAALETQRALRVQAEGLAERNAEDAALWRAHYNRTYGSTTNLWVNADGTTTPVQPSTTASAESARLASVVAKVEALADEWTAEANRLQEFADRHQGYYQGIVSARRTCRDDLRAAIASVAPDTATPGERRMTYVDAKTHEPCPTSGPVLCTIGYTDSAHRHVAAHMVAASSADDKAGEAHPRTITGVVVPPRREGIVG